MTATETDNKAGWSTHCRRGEFETCARLSARCTNPRHGTGGQVPPRNEPVPLHRDRGQHDDIELPEGFVWQDPPPRSQGQWEPLLSPLLANPNRWARVRHYKSKSGAGSAARSLRAGKVMAGRWEAEGRVLAAGSDLYVRYLGPARG